MDTLISKLLSLGYKEQEQFILFVKEKFTKDEAVLLLSKIQSLEKDLDIEKKAEETFERGKDSGFCDNFSYYPIVWEGAVVTCSDKEAFELIKSKRYRQVPFYNETFSKFRIGWANLSLTYKEDSVLFEYQLEGSIRKHFWEIKCKSDRHRVISNCLQVMSAETYNCVKLTQVHLNLLHSDGWKVLINDLVSGKVPIVFKRKFVCGAYSMTQNLCV